ncbi:YbaK/EbsC family protein, partial [Patescibacteria group bacterium]|nr:YbaK/EbsC family protein [Patescibacteria group bacterium]
CRRIPYSATDPFINNFKKYMAKQTKISAKIVNYLEKTGVKHNILEHKTVYTALDIATTMRKKLGEIVKSLLVVADKDYYLVLLPADHNLDFKKLAKAVGKLKNKTIKTIKIPEEKVMESLLKIKAGAMSAFGGIYKLPVIIDKKLVKLKNGFFSSGSFNHSIEMAIKDFVKLEKASLADFSIKKKIKILKIVKIRKVR